MFVAFVPPWPLPPCVRAWTMSPKPEFTTNDAWPLATVTVIVPLVLPTVYGFVTPPGRSSLCDQSTSAAVPSGQWLLPAAELGTMPWGTDAGHAAPRQNALWALAVPAPTPRATMVAAAAAK